MAEFNQIPAELIVARLIANNVTIIDVRAEKEFAQGALPFSINAPILRDPERHAVGLAYKQQGIAAATELGHQLVQSTKAERIKIWREIAATKSATVMCWRGGARSQIACEWLQPSGATEQVVGGYKAVRRILLAALTMTRDALILSGATGSGKTELLNECHSKTFVDLEKLAHHRGSAFGPHFDGKGQPTQATFENALAIELLRAEKSEQPLLLEDESSAIGKVYLPHSLQESIARGKTIELRIDFAARVENIYRDYVTLPLTTNSISLQQLGENYCQALRRIKRRLGGVLTDLLLVKVQAAFAIEKNAELHRDWISLLLRNYYDRAYAHALKRFDRQTIFAGNKEECRQWILHQFA